MKTSFKWLQTYFEEELPLAQELADVLTFHSFEIEGVEQVGDDWVIDIDVLPNRSSDCLSHRGIARELATILARPLKRDPLRDSLPAWDTVSEVLQVEVEDAKVCSRYMGAVLRGVTVGPSPTWLKERLETLGQRSINNVVDATNYVMLDVGQPLHAFDLDKLQVDESNCRTIAVRPAEEGERITLLTGEERTLAPHHTLIADGVSGVPLAIAGVKGGKAAEIGVETVDLVLECANFHYGAIRKTSRELRLATDASLRFQNEVPPQLGAFAMRDLIALIEDVAGGTLVGVCDVYAEPGEGMPVELSLSQINTLLGTALSIDDVERILVRFEWEFSRADEIFVVTPPWERTDLHIKEDIIEEIGRVHGYRSMQGVLPPLPAHPPHVHKGLYYSEMVRRVLSGLGYSEVYTYTLQDRGEVELLNPLAADKSCMRMDLRTGILGALELNSNNGPYLGLDTVKVFELGPVFRTKGEILHCALGARAVSGKQSKTDIALMADLATLAESLGQELTNESPQDGIVEFSLDALLPGLPEPEGYAPALVWDPATRYQPWSVYPCIYRDIAVWVPQGTPAEEVLALVLEAAPDILVKHYQFDSFEKDGRVSYAWHLVFQSTERTLTDDEVAPIMDAVTTALNAKEGWEVR